MTPQPAQRLYGRRLQTESRAAASLASRRADPFARRSDSRVQTEPRKPRAGIQGAEHRIEFVGGQERDVQGRHELAEPRNIEHGPNAEVEGDSTQDHPAASGPEPQPERQRELRQDCAMRQEIDKERILGKPLEIEPAEFTVEKHVMYARAVAQSGPWHLITLDWK